ncbi:putative bifunctional diguanylate cyclase/phosphodiesterase [Quadrisphaera oryzae]|uniref:putative bifunctional diguanylate cyclase/phosphodiesterase n=1 Tax=Quadrisphaera TaxID=317661 RepID=UPI001646D855|nr:bifunctional diguanylate cyclase/phosphodiesterase [Quadrisphaera sp. RL12-1S]MBC3760085.1 bifunctional diguanylate cyclase/phosphodiesterase [Quadrisphaera sp. RL12-1S]
MTSSPGPEPPQGAELSSEVFELRHRWVTGVLVGLALGLAVWVLTPGTPRASTVPLTPLLVFVALTAATALVALRPWRSLSARASCTLRATATSTGCFAAASLVVALTGGAAEAHFLFFVLVPLVALYEMAVPFLVLGGFVFLEHGVVGSLWPQAVFGYGYPGSEDVWVAAAVHSALFAAGCAGSVLAWRGARSARREAARVVSLLRERATHDELTGLANRAGLARVLGSALTGTPQDLAVVVVDLNRFKEVNDTLGHDAGDVLLRGVAQVMVETVGDRGVLARLGGDEFALVLPGADGRTACAVAEQLREQVRERSTVAGIALDLDLSAGVALHVADQELDAAAAHTASGELLRHADIAMYTAKRGGGGAVVYDPAMDHHSTARLEVARELRTAIAQRDQLVLHYQPKISLVGESGASAGPASGTLVGVEALVRWQHPVRGFMPPGDFIPLLETTDLVHSFTAYMIDMALDQAQAWFLSGHEVPIAVNAFPRCLTHPDFLPHVAHALHVRGLPAHLLRLEITEDALVADPETASTVITQLRELGVATSIDDFGTGYSSLSYLRRLPVDEVKLDRSFVTGLGSAAGGEGGDEVLVASIIDLAHRLGMKVVAEGVEDPAETRALRALGCDVAQGYLFARPAPAAALAPELLATSRRWWRAPAQGRVLTGEMTGPASAGLGSSSG